VFTGIVQGCGTVAEVVAGDGITTLRIDLPDTNGLVRGASVAINGTCLTATDMDGPRVSFDVIPETLERTTLGQLVPGHKVNVERSLKMGDELGGHLLSGHIMFTANVSHFQRNGDGATCRLTVPNAFTKYVLEKGYIGVHGASLTVGAVHGAGFDVHLIPETLALTNLGDLNEGDRVNIEIDTMTQTIVNTVERMLTNEVKS
jgi:riboflavin synthase